VDTEPGEGSITRTGLVIMAVALLGIGVVGIGVSIGLVDVGHRVFGVADGPFGVVEVGLGWAGAGGDAETPVLVEHDGSAQAGSVEVNGRAWCRDLTFGWANIGVRERKARRPVWMAQRWGNWGVRLLRRGCDGGQGQYQEDGWAKAWREAESTAGQDRCQRRYQGRCSIHPARQTALGHRVLHFIADGLVFQC